METCSYGEVVIQPYSGTLNGKSISNGVYEVSVPNTLVVNQDNSVVRDAVLAQLTSDLGDLRNTFDHVILCLPAGTIGTWVAYGEWTEMCWQTVSRVDQKRA